MAKRFVTFEGATPAGGGEQIGELQVEDDAGHRVLLRLNEPVEVDESLAKAAEAVDHHNVLVQTPGEYEKSQAGEQGGEA